MFKKRLKYFFSGATLTSLLTNLLQALGILWLLFEVASYFSPGFSDKKSILFYFFISAALVWTVIRSFPRLNHHKKSKPSNTEIEIKVGNLFKEPGYLAIGCSDCFDTEPETVIGSRSLMAQLVKNSFSGNYNILDGKISQSMYEQKIHGIPLSEKKFGKTERFPIGAVAVIQLTNQKVFLFAFSTTNNDKTTTTTKEDLWASLCQLWTEVRKQGFLEPISVPVFGAGLARFPASRISLIQLLLLSFAIATRENIVSRKLTLVISESDYDPEEMAEAIELVNTLEF